MLEAMPQEHYWNPLGSAVNKHNSLPFVKDVNRNLADHINSRALFALFDLIESKEAVIRNDVSQRISDLLKTVFARQD